jgi:hypothetical protein
LVLLWHLADGRQVALFLNSFEFEQLIFSYYLDVST